jgi:16S rRNA (cytosine1402-N4)-methyltransferase
METTAHRPVLLRETLEALAVGPGGFWVDGTVGAGGHAEAILRATAPDGRLLACDRDAEALAASRLRLAPFGERVVLRHADYRRLPALLDEIGAPPVSGILLDLGISSLQLDDPGRGFSFQQDGPLDMRIDRSQPTTAADLVNALAEERLAAILRDHGEEKAAGRIARAVARERTRAPIATTRRLAEIVASAAPPRGASRIHPATRTFQALRIEVNRELDGLDRLIEEAVARLAPRGRCAIISFHSLEDRVVKRTFRGLTRHCVCPRDLPVCACGRPGVVRLITPKALRPSVAEARENPRSRSARLRVVERLETTA